MKYQHILAEVARKPWAILPEKFHSIAAFLALAASGGKLSEEEVREVVQAGPRVSPRTPGTVALIQVYGVINHRSTLMSQFSGGTSTEKIASQFRNAMADSSVKAIVMDVDSPGGSVDGVPELCEEIRAGRKVKKSVAVANTMAASAAYWIASACDELICTPSGSVGSIGVFAAHEDLSKALEAEGVKMSLVSAGKYKTEGNPYEPLNEAARTEMQAKVDAYYDMFVKAVAKNRGASQASVTGGFGQGRMVMADAAMDEDMCDGVATLESVLARFGVSLPVQQQPQQARSVAQLRRELDLHS
jgi:signal peptide peptidase SppA